MAGNVGFGAAGSAVRAFVCVPLDDSALDEIAGFMDKIKHFAGFRWVAGDTLHITLKFLGDITPEQMTRLDTNLSRIGGSRPFKISLSGAGAFPSMSSPRTLWLGVGDGAGALSRLAASVERAAVASGCEAEVRPFHPHVTLARARSRDGVSMPERLAAALRECPFPSWTCGGFILMRSELSPHGPRHAPVAAFEL